MTQKKGPPKGIHSSKQNYKVKLTTGRILGPIPLERIALLILKNQIQGTEKARKHPQGEWQMISEIPELSELVISHLQGRLKVEPRTAPPPAPLFSVTAHPLEMLAIVPEGTTALIPEPSPAPGNSQAGNKKNEGTDETETEVITGTTVLGTLAQAERNQLLNSVHLSGNVSSEVNSQGSSQDTAALKETLEPGLTASSGLSSDPLALSATPVSLTPIPLKESLSSALNSTSHLTATVPFDSLKDSDSLSSPSDSLSSSPSSYSPSSSASSSTNEPTAPSARSHDSWAVTQIDPLLGETVQQRLDEIEPLDSSDTSLLTPSQEPHLDLEQLDHADGDEDSLNVQASVNDNSDSSHSADLFDPLSESTQASNQHQEAHDHSESTDQLLDFSSDSHLASHPFSLQNWLGKVLPARNSISRDKKTSSLLQELIPPQAMKWVQALLQKSGLATPFSSSDSPAAISSASASVSHSKDQKQAPELDLAQSDFLPEPAAVEPKLASLVDEKEVLLSSVSEDSKEPKKKVRGELILSAQGDKTANALAAHPLALSQAATVLFQRSTSERASLQGFKKLSLKQMIFVGLASVALGSLAYDTFFGDESNGKFVKQVVIRPVLPSAQSGVVDTNKSMELYKKAMAYYVQDTVQAYILSAAQLRQAAALDMSNVKALAMLASCYINLIDSSNKDENYFSVISKLIELSRAKALDLTETVIADVEFYIVVNKPEAAENRVVEYTKSHANFGLEMFYYISLAYFERGNLSDAVKFLSQVPDNKVFSAKVFYLKGQIAEGLKDPEAAMAEYKKAIKMNPNHAKSYLKIAKLHYERGHLKDAELDLKFLETHPNLLSAHDLGRAHYLLAIYYELMQKLSLALSSVERANKLDPENHDYLLELYTLRAKLGDSKEAMQKQARMYYFLGEAEKLIQQGLYEEAIMPLLEARKENDRSYLPLVKAGDMFSYLNDIENAKMNYRLATERANNNIQVWSKYIQVLIQSFEWDEAEKAMKRFRNIPGAESAIDKAAADMYQKQGRFVEAQLFYRKAMARDYIDPAVYIAYAKSLMSTKNFVDAPFFFALALRQDPLNVDAVIYTAKCVAETDSIDHAISLLQDELKVSRLARAEFLSAIAELQIQKGAWDQAQQNVNQAVEANPNYAYPWKLQAQIHLNRENVDRLATEKALLAYKSYSERNSSDPSGYLERYKIYARKSDFENAKAELNKVFEIYPKYPSLHYYLGTLYAAQGNHKAATEELSSELANNPNQLQAMLLYGKELLEQDRIQDALTEFTKVMRAFPRSPDAKQNAGWANYKQKNFTAAVALIREAISIDSANPTLYKRMGIVYRDMGDIPSACTSFKKYLEMEPDAPDKAEFASCF